MERAPARRLGVEDRAGEGAGAGAGLDDDERVGPGELVPPSVERPPDDRAEQRPDLRARQEVAPAAGTTARRVEAGVVGVEREVEVLVEADRPAAADAFLDGARRVP
jgi:hypothetical protein